MNVSDAPGGVRAFENTASSVAWLSSAELVPVNRHWTYEVSGSFRRANLNGSAGGISVAVRLFDENRNNIDGDSRWWYLPHSNVGLTDADWHTLNARFGSGTGRALPPTARYMSVGAILNVDTGDVAGNRFYQVTGLAITRAARSAIYVPDTRPGCPPASAGVGQVLISTTFTLDRGTFTALDARIISSGSGRRDTSLRVDGVTVNKHLVRTEIADWAPHQNAWTGWLASGSHTVSFHGENNIGYGCGGEWGHLSVKFIE